MKPVRRARPRQRTRRDRLDDTFAAQQRWLLLAIGVLLTVALISFALDLFHDPLVHRILLILLAISGVGVVVVVPLGFGASVVFWRTKATTRPAGRQPRGGHVPRATYLGVGLAALAVFVLYLGNPSWRGWLWPAYVIVSGAVIARRLLLRRKD